MKEEFLKLITKFISWSGQDGAAEACAALCNQKIKEVLEGEVERLEAKLKETQDALALTDKPHIHARGAGKELGIKLAISNLRQTITKINKEGCY